MLIKCTECGKEISTKADICQNCGVKLKKRRNKNLLIIPLVLLVLVLGAIIYIQIGRMKLKETLLKDWERVEKGSSSSYYTLELDFSETTIQYNFNSTYSWLDTTIAKFEYKVIDAHRIKIDDKIYEITFNDDKDMMIITPSLTDSKSSENWFYHKN